MPISKISRRDCAVISVDCGANLGGPWVDREIRSLGAVARFKLATTSQS
jgi:hypothetical protein